MHDPYLLTHQEWMHIQALVSATTHQYCGDARGGMLIEMTHTTRKPLMEVF